MGTLTIKSPAKLNLFLKIIRKRPDGYHDIVTLFERINLFDEITLSISKDKEIHLSCPYPGVPEDEGNLAYKAALLLSRKTGISKGVKIKIKKNIPVAAGLGGGSSNAAAVLAGLNRLWQLNLSRRSLLASAKRIGSDVPFFLYDCPYALGTGRGDTIRPIKIETKLWHVLAVPKTAIRSAEVYQGLSRRVGFAVNGSMNILTKPYYNVSILIHYLRANDIMGASALLANDLEQEIVRIKPSLLRLKKQMASLPTKAVMISGSGPAVFGLTTTAEDAYCIKEILAKRFSRVFVVKTF